MKLSIRAIILTSTMLVPLSFANANAGSKLYVCATPQQNNLLQADYEALTWVEVSALGNHGEAGSSTNILNYDTWGDIVIQKAKGLTDAGSPDVEVARIANDAGQIILRNAAKTNLNYAFKMTRNDQVTPTSSPTVLYNRGLVTGPRRPFGRNEDFDLEIFTLALNQVELVVNAGIGGNQPLNTVAPAITGTPKVGTVLTVSNGTFTGDPTITYAYRWYAGGVPIDGATASTYTPVVADIGKIMSCRVVASNASGSAVGVAAPTAVVAA